MTSNHSTNTAAAATAPAPATPTVARTTTEILADLRKHLKAAKDAEKKLLADSRVRLRSKVTAGSAAAVESAGQWAALVSEFAAAAESMAVLAEDELRPLLGRVRGREKVRVDNVWEKAEGQLEALLDGVVEKDGEVKKYLGVEDEEEDDDDDDEDVEMEDVVVEVIEDEEMYD